MALFAAFDFGKWFSEMGTTGWLMVIIAILVFILFITWSNRGNYPTGTTGGAPWTMGPAILIVGIVIGACGMLAYVKSGGDIGPISGGSGSTGGGTTTTTGKHGVPDGTPKDYLTVNATTGDVALNAKGEALSADWRIAVTADRKTGEVVRKGEPRSFGPSGEIWAYFDPSPAMVAKGATPNTMTKLR